MDTYPSLVVTLGPSSLPHVATLARAGATALRLNASHLDVDALRSSVARIDAARPGFPIVVDLQGAKLRLGLIAPRTVEPGQRLTFALEAQEKGWVPVPHPELFAWVRAGATLLVDDARLAFRVTSIRRAAVEVECVRGGLLRPRKGVNVADHPVSPEDLSADDQAAIEALGTRAHTSFAVSFAATGREAEWVRRRAKSARVVAKLERREALEAVSALDDAFDELWLCRGDLGAQLGEVAMARVVGWFDPRGRKHKVLLAGQVFEHLTQAREPTRSEVCHVHDVLARGFAGLVLSDETAIGVDPVNAVEVASRLVGAFAG